MTISAGTVIIGAKIDFSKLQSQLKKVTRAVAKAAKRMSRAFLNVAAGLAKALLAITAIAGAGILWGIKEAIQYETALNKLTKTLIATGGAAGLSRKELVNNAKHIQKISTTSETAALGMQALLLTFKNIAGPTFKRTTKAILDMSEGMGQDLKSSTIQLGKALNDPITGMSALSRIGIKFTDSQIEMIKSLQNSNKLFEAQSIILDEVESQFGGLATEMTTTAQMLFQLKNAWNDFLKAFGTPFLPMIKKVSAALKKFFEEQTEAIEKFTALFEVAFTLKIKEEGLGKALKDAALLLFDIVKIKTIEWFNNLRDLLIPLFERLGFIVGDAIKSSLPTHIAGIRVRKATASEVKEVREELRQKARDIQENSLKVAFNQIQQLEKEQRKRASVKPRSVPIPGGSVMTQGGRRDPEVDERIAALKLIFNAQLDAWRSGDLERIAVFNKFEAEVIKKINKQIADLDKQLAELTPTFTSVATQMEKIKVRTSEANKEVDKLFTNFIGSIEELRAAAKKLLEDRKAVEAKIAAAIEKKRLASAKRQAELEAKMGVAPSPERLSAIGSALVSESRKLFTGARGGELVATTAAELFGIAKSGITAGDELVANEVRILSSRMLAQPAEEDRLRNTDYNNRVLHYGRPPENSFNPENRF